jgi:hypothetical protein
MSEARYSPSLRTAVVLTGSGTAGAYHAGVLRALQEAGVRVDLVAGHGVGALSAMFAAIDGGSRLWEPDGLWRGRGVERLYPWSPRLRATGWALAVALACVALPVALLLGAGLMYLTGWLLALAGTAGGSLAVNGAARRLLEALFDPGALPTIVPRLALLAVMVAVAILVVAWLSGGRRRPRHQLGGAASLLGAPLDARPAVARASAGLWDLIRGAAPLAAPVPREISRRYAEMVGENAGQPGFRELLIVAHDLDARRDVTFALLAEPHRARFERRRGEMEAFGPRRQDDLVDLSAAGRDHALDALAAALCLPLATEPHIITYSPESYWRGESHRLCDRPSAAVRVIEEVAAAGAAQVIVISAASSLEGPHALAPARVDARGHGGEYLAATEAAALHDARAAAVGQGVTAGAMFEIRPTHNPVGPLDFGGAWDARSDRHHSLGELIERGYEDAYRQFIEPIVGAGGDVVEQRT